VNIDAAAKLRQKSEVEAKLRNILQIHSKQRKIQVFTPKQIDAYFKLRDQVFGLFRSKFELQRIKKNPSTIRGITLHVPQECNIQALFESWRRSEEDTTHLFGELDDLSSEKWLISWNIKFKAIIVDGTFSCSTANM
jgi:hypothetical protein